MLVSSVLSANEEYIIISGGARATGGYDKDKSDKIFVLDIRDETEYKLRECSIKAPKAGFNPIIRMGGISHKLLVIGWIKGLFKTKEFRNISLPPTYIMELILSWYFQEVIYWTENLCDGSERALYQIPVKHILSSLI